MIWGCYSSPYVYANELGPGGQTAPRYVHSVKPDALGQLGPFDDLILPAELPPLPGIPPIPEGGIDPESGLPIVTEQQAAQREAAAFQRGKEEERAAFIKQAAIGAAVSAVVGILIGRLAR